MLVSYCKRRQILLKYIVLKEPYELHSVTLKHRRHSTQISFGQGRKQTSIKATAIAPTITKAEFSTAHSIREMDRPPSSVNFSMSEHLIKETLKPVRNITYQISTVLKILLRYITA